MSRKRTSKGGAKRTRRRAPAILVFGEDDNDRRALKELVQALAPGAPAIHTRRKPLVLIKDRELAKQRKNAGDIAEQVRIAHQRHEVRLVVAHQDCDAREPAHEAVATEIEERVGEAGVPVVAATPAWEMEAWWYQWPDAVLSVVSRWKHPNREGSEIGRVRNAKEQLMRDLRPGGKNPPRDYEESDAPEIAAAVREQGLVDQRNVKSASFERFANKVRQALATDS